MVRKDLKIIGSNTSVELLGHDVVVPAKVDTGADSSSIWASDIFVDKEGHLHFTLFDKTSEYYTGEEIIRKTFKVASVKSASGHIQIRYRTEMLVRMGGRKIRVQFGLSNRASHKFPILIGRRTLVNKFLVNVQEKEFERLTGDVTQSLNDELKKNPYAFYKKYHSKEEK